MVSRYAVVQDGVVTNIAEWDGETPWDPGPTCDLYLLEEDSTVAIGWITDGEDWTCPEVAPPVAEGSHPISVAPEDLAAFVAGMQDPEASPQQVLADFVSALNVEQTAPLT